MKKTSRISSDGKSLLTRIPKKIQEEANLKKGEKLEWSASGNKLGVMKYQEPVSKKEDAAVSKEIDKMDKLSQKDENTNEVKK